MKKFLFCLFGLFFVVGAGLFLSACSSQQSSEIILKGGEKFGYEFTEKPKVGEVILKVLPLENVNSEINVFAEYDMPSMRGHHASGKQQFLNNKTGDYVLPIHFAMPGDWEIVLSFEKNNQSAESYTINLNI